MNTRKFGRELQKAKKEKTPRFRESFRFGTGEQVLCESKAHYDVLDGMSNSLEDLVMEQLLSQVQIVLMESEHKHWQKSVHKSWLWR